MAEGYSIQHKKRTQYWSKKKKKMLFSRNKLARPDLVSPGNRAVKGLSLSHKWCDSNGQERWSSPIGSNVAQVVGHPSEKLWEGEHFAPS